MREQPSHVLTVGHSTHSIEKLIGLLKMHAVTAVADVRSAPFSRRNPQFNKDVIDRSLSEQGIRYVFLGRELGARSDDPSCYEGGRVRYERLAQTELFRQGIKRVIQGTREQRVALLCAEKEPLECHRTLLVARALEEQGIHVDHILSDGRLESHEESMSRLLAMTGLPHEDLFRSRQDLMAQALALQEAKVAYVDEKLGVASARDAP